MKNENKEKWDEIEKRDSASLTVGLMFFGVILYVFRMSWLGIALSGVLLDAMKML